jgi:HTH-type transcriptional regulator / antitoxin HigA
MDIKPIRTKADHKAALKQVSRLVDHDPARGTPEGDLLDVLSTLVAAYEAKHVAMAWRLHVQLGIPAESLIQPPEAA